MTNKQRGVTLIEVMVTMGLLSVFLVILSGVFISALEMSSQTGSYSAVTSEGRFVLTRLGYDIRRASAVSTPAAAGDTDSSLTLTIDGSDYTYSLVGDRLQLDIDGDTNFLTSEQASVSSLSFQKLGDAGQPTSVRYSFTVSSDSLHYTDSQTYSDTTGLRP